MLEKRPTLWKYNEDLYIVVSSEQKFGFNIIQKSNGMLMAKGVRHYGWNMSKGYYYGNSRQRQVNHEQGRFKLIGSKR